MAFMSSEKDSKNSSAKSLLTQNVVESFERLSISNQRMYEFVLQPFDVGKHPLFEFGVDHHGEIAQLFNIFDQFGAGAVHLDDAVMCIDIANKADTDHAQCERTKQQQTAFAAGQLFGFLRFALTIHIAASAQEEDQKEEQRQDEPKAGHCDNDACLGEKEMGCEKESWFQLNPAESSYENNHLPNDSKY